MTSFFRINLANIKFIRYAFYGCLTFSSVNAGFIKEIFDDYFVRNAVEGPIANFVYYRGDEEKRTNDFLRQYNSWEQTNRQKINQHITQKQKYLSYLYNNLQEIKQFQPQTQLSKIQNIEQFLSNKFNRLQEKKDFFEKFITHDINKLNELYQSIAAVRNGPYYLNATQEQKNQINSNSQEIMTKFQVAKNSGRDQHYTNYLKNHHSQMDEAQKSTYAAEQVSHYEQLAKDFEEITQLGLKGILRQLRVTLLHNNLQGDDQNMLTDISLLRGGPGSLDS